MNSYKIGNKVTGIIRSYNSDPIGTIVIDYDNQPYTIVKSAAATLTFSDLNVNAKSSFTQLAYNNNKLTQIEISDVTLNDKILNMIFAQADIKLASRIENYTTDEEKQIYLTSPQEQIYQVFLYNNDGQLEAAYGSWDASLPIPAEKSDTNYLICYQYEETKGYSLDKPVNHYFTLDLLITGNKEDQTTNMTLHVEKCSLKVDKNMYFNQRSNAINLIFVVIDTGANYITLE